MGARRGAEEGSAERGAGAPFTGMRPWSRSRRVVQMPIHARLRGQIPEGPSSALRRAHCPCGDATAEAHISTRIIRRRIPLRGGRRSVEQGPACGMRPWSRPLERRTPAHSHLRGQIPQEKSLGPLFRPSTRHPSASRRSPAPPSAGAFEVQMRSRHLHEIL